MQSKREAYLHYEELCSQLSRLLCGQLRDKRGKHPRRRRPPPSHGRSAPPTLAARMEMMATAILCMFWSSWLQSHCITSLAASNLPHGGGGASTQNHHFMGLEIYFTRIVYKEVVHLLNGTSCRMRSLHRDRRQFFCSYRRKHQESLCTPVCNDLCMLTKRSLPMPTFCMLDQYGPNVTGSSSNISDFFPSCWGSSSWFRAVCLTNEE